MPAYSDLLMGYRESGPEANITLMRYAGRCIFCNYRVHVVPSGFDILQRDDCDAKLVCKECYETAGPDELERAMADG
jgi:hypothetical protein